MGGNETSNDEVIENSSLDFGLEQQQQQQPAEFDINRTRIEITNDASRQTKPLI